MPKFLILTILLGAAVVLFLGPTKTNWEDIKSLTRQKVEFNLALDNSLKLRELSNTLLDEFNAIPLSDKTALNKLLTSKVEPIKIVMEIEKIARNNGLILKDINTEKISSNKKSNKGTAVKEEAVKTLSINFSTIGSYRSFTAFLKDIEKSLRIMDINSLSLKAGDGDLYTFQIILKTYFGNKQKILQ